MDQKADGPGRGTIMKSLAQILLAGLSVAVAGGASYGQETIKVGVVRSMANGPLLLATEKGYFKEAGIKVELENLQSSATAMASLAQGQLNIIAGGVSAGYFNALAKNLPIIITIDRVTTPVGHNLMIRTDLKDQIKSIRDLKGKVVASNAPGSISTYEIGKILETVGLSINDVEIKNIPFGQYALALQNKAVDAALAIPPFTFSLTDNKLAVPFASADELVRPTPLTIAVHLVNTEWAQARQELVRNFYVAAIRGIRDYCDAYHGGAVRKQLIDLLVSSGTERRPELPHKNPWPGRNLNGKLNPASLLDVQDWFFRNKFVTAKLPLERLVDYSYADYAQQKLGPFTLENKDSKIQGCR
jgi:NitT/TauT family transport system substrate-binding protein